ncbi:SDR family oxidoreductase [Phaeodactylibacter luteus]|uniref:SDR family oxidoreductase n=1 Tax=Phaeodactylibacter luteus TaxID=1564516 RepID=A0A5C6RPF1_9BACT|nr:SDR family oxidoreductase [Phaeodactylibacter luteus]TXB63550.1 SDR family oxidoreductase [Phaeodactylibacter luteus]
MNFKDKVIWITGASSGIGEAMAYAFAEQGADLILSARNEKELSRVQQNCPKHTRTLVLPMDVTDFDAMSGLAARAVNHFGKINVLVNNAGISQRALVKDTALAVDRKIMDVNFIGTVAVTKAVLPYMIRQKNGHIIAISSVMGKIGTPRRSAYAASKHALHGFFDCLRAEVAEQNIQVTIICPGYVHTNVSINALTADGSPNNQMSDDSKSGLQPEEFAVKALKAIYKKKEEVYIGKREILGIYLKRYAPWVLSRVVRGMKVT